MSRKVTSIFHITWITPTWNAYTWSSRLDLEVWMIFLYCHWLLWPRTARWHKKPFWSHGTFKNYTMVLRSLLPSQICAICTVISYSMFLKSSGYVKCPGLITQFVQISPIPLASPCTALLCPCPTVSNSCELCSHPAHIWQKASSNL